MADNNDDNKSLEQELTEHLGRDPTPVELDIARVFTKELEENKHHDCPETNKLLQSLVKQELQQSRSIDAFLDEQDRRNGKPFTKEERDVMRAFAVDLAGDLPSDFERTSKAVDALEAKAPCLELPVVITAPKALETLPSYGPGTVFDSIMAITEEDQVRVRQEMALRLHPEKVYAESFVVNDNPFCAKGTKIVLVLTPRP